MRAGAGGEVEEADADGDALDGAGLEEEAGVEVAAFGLRRGAADAALDAPATVVVAVVHRAGVGDLVDELVGAVVVQRAAAGGAKGLVLVPRQRGAAGDGGRDGERTYDNPTNLLAAIGFGLGYAIDPNRVTDSEARRVLDDAAGQLGDAAADPAALGADRWAALIGAWHLTGGACVVVNAGTTMTVDALNGEGVFLGGCIVPGAALMREALARDTANLALRAGAFSYFPDNTGDAIFSGTVNALSGAVAQVVQYLQQSAGVAPRVLLSGGDAALIEARINGTVTVVDNLVLEGLLQIARQDD